MFDAVPRRYDLLNRVLTLRLDERWRRRAAARCLAAGPSRVLDLCCGTGDLAVHMAKQAGDDVEVIGLDYSPPMLEIAEAKARGASRANAIGFVTGDAADMEFPDARFDAVGIAFAFRNLTWRNPLKDKSLAEVLRVLRPGGIFVVVETSQPRNKLLRGAFHAYLSSAVSFVGSRISGHKSAYRYLAESARKFHDANEVMTMLSDAGFVNIHGELLLGGVAAIHTAYRPKPR
jgi:demethylmenaquinone methyltransferase/2-methoxy-6-polyprenyl-1,4-benzoquinol methylase